MQNKAEFNELEFFAHVKKKPGLYMGTKSLKSLRDQLFGMMTAFAYCGRPSELGYFKGFMEWYNERLFRQDRNGYVCWWNHLLYVSGSHDDLAFDQFFASFESYLHEAHGLKLPDAE